MAQHARIEEVSDSASDSDPSEMDPTDFDPSNTLIRPAAIPRPAHIPQPSNNSPAPQLQLQPQLAAPTSTSSPADTDRYKHYQCLYPVYFDATRTRAQGRRVGREQAVRNPLAREMVDAVQALGLSVVFEPGKTHPKDWSNPGRVRVLVRLPQEQGGRAASKGVKNSAFLPVSSCFSRAKLIFLRAVVGERVLTSVGDQNIICTRWWRRICGRIPRRRRRRCGCGLRGCRRRRSWCRRRCRGAGRSGRSCRCIRRR